MKELTIKPKTFGFNGVFIVQDEQGKDAYFIEINYLQSINSYSIKDQARNEVALITKKPISLFPKFRLKVKGQKELTLKKKIAFLKARFIVEATRMEVRGNRGGTNFKMYRRGQMAGEININEAEGGTLYRLQLLDEELEILLLSIIVAIDCVIKDQSSIWSAI